MGDKPNSFVHGGGGETFSHNNISGPLQRQMLQDSV